MITTATLWLLGYCIASAYVVVPAALLLLCCALARCHVRIELEPTRDEVRAQRDVYARRAVVAFYDWLDWQALDPERAATELASALRWRRMACDLDAVLRASW